MSSLLVTGGAGFIGCSFVRHVLDHTDHTVTVLDALAYAGNAASLYGLPKDRFRLIARWLEWVGQPTCPKLRPADHDRLSAHRDIAADVAPTARSLVRVRNSR